MPWLTAKKCYRDAQVSTLKKEGPVGDHSLYVDEYKGKQATRLEPVLLRPEQGPKESIRCFDAVLADTVNTNTPKKQGLRGYSAIRESHMPWTQRGLTSGKTKEDEYRDACTSSKGLRAVPYGAHHSHVHNDEPKKGGLRSSPYCDKFVSNVF